MGYFNQFHFKHKEKISHRVKLKSYKIVSLTKLKTKNHE